MKLPGKILLFFSSYLPCWVIVSTSQGYQLNAISIFGILLIITSLFTIWVFKKTYSNPTIENNITLYVNNISNGSSEVISYLLTLVIPVASSRYLFNIVQGEYVDTLFISIIAITIFLIYITSNLIVINPMLMIFGYSLYLINYKTSNESTTTVEGILITGHKFNPENIESIVSVQKIDNTVYVLMM